MRQIEPATTPAPAANEKPEMYWQGPKPGELSGGFRFQDIIGLFPEADDAFIESIMAVRRRERGRP